MIMQRKKSTQILGIPSKLFSDESGIIYPSNKMNQKFIPFISERDSMGRMITHSLHQMEPIFLKQNNSSPILDEIYDQSFRQAFDQYKQKDKVLEPYLIKNDNIKNRSKKLMDDIRFGKKRQQAKSNLVLGMKNTEFIVRTYIDENNQSYNQTPLNEKSSFKQLQRHHKSISLISTDQDIQKTVPMSCKSVIKDKIIINHQPKLFKAIDHSQSVPSIGHYQTDKLYENNIFPRTRQTIISSKMFSPEGLKTAINHEKQLKLQQSLEDIQQRRKQKLIEEKSKSIKSSETDQIYAQLRLPSIGSSKRYVKEFMDRNRHLVLNVHPIDDYEGFPKDFEQNLIQQKKHIRGLRNRVRAWGNNEKDNKQELQEQAQKILENANKN